MIGSWEYILGLLLSYDADMENQEHIYIGAIEVGSDFAPVMAG